jgi:hypothetical protein
VNASRRAVVVNRRPHRHPGGGTGWPAQVPKPSTPARVTVAMVLSTSRSRTNRVRPPRRRCVRAQAGSASPASFVRCDSVDAGVRADPGNASPASLVRCDSRDAGTRRPCRLLASPSWTRFRVLRLWTPVSWQLWL